MKKFIILLKRAEMKMGKWKSIGKLWAAIALALVLILAVPQKVFAYPEITDASLSVDGVTVPDDANFLVVNPGAKISATVQVTGTGDNYWNDWKSTSWRVGTSSSDYGWTCVDTDDYTDGSPHTETFDITAPSTPGIYNVYFRTWTSNGCYLPNQFSDMDTGSMPKSIVVLGNPDMIESFGAGCTTQEDEFGGGQGVCMKAGGLEDGHWQIRWLDPSLSIVRTIEADVTGGEFIDSWLPYPCKSGTWSVELRKGNYNPVTHTTVYSTKDLDTFNLSCGPSIASYQADCSTMKNNFDYGDTVCMKSTALGTNPFYLWQIQWWAPEASSATRTKQVSVYPFSSYSDSWVPSPCVAGTWTVSLDRRNYLSPLSVWSSVDTDTFNLTCDGCTPPSITTQPINQTISYGDDASFTVAGTDYTSIQWQVNTGTGWSNISGATSATLYITQPAASLSGNQYRVVLTGGCDPSVISNVVTLTVNTDPFLSFSDLTSSLNPSVYGDTVTFKAVATTSGGAPLEKVIFYEFVIEGYNTTQIPLGEDLTGTALGENSYEYTFSISTLTIGDHAIFAYYNDGSGMSSALAGPLQQTVVDKIWPTVTITSAPPQTTYSRQATFEFSSNTAGTAFECSLNDGDLTNMESWTWSACSSPKVYTDLSYGEAYGFAVKIQGAPITNTTMAGHLWYIDLPTVTISDGPAEVIESTEATLTFSSNPTGVDLVCYLAKYESTTQAPVVLENWVPCTSPRTFTGLSHGYSYYFSVKPEGVADYYAAIRYWTITRLTIASSVNPSEFGNDVTFTATLWDNRGTLPGGTVTFAEMVPQWPGGFTLEYFGQSSSPTASGTGSYTYTFLTSELTVGSHDIVALYTDDGGTITSLPITQVVTEVIAKAPVITTQPVNHTACAGSTVNFTAAASGTPTPTVQWQVSSNGGASWTNISGATSATYSFTAGADDNGKRYHAIFTNSAGSATSSSAILTVNSAPSFITQPTDKTVTYGTSGVTFSSAASGTALSVQWRRSMDGTNWELVSGATAPNLTITNPTVSMSGTRYRVEFSNTCGIATSNAATLTVNKAQVTITAGNYTGVYDGVAHPPSNCKVTGDYTGGLSCTNNPATVGPDVGSGSVVPVLVLNGEIKSNFEITPRNGTWKITPASVTLTAGNYNGTYDGKAHAPSGCVMTGTYTGDLICTNDPSSVGPNVGSGIISPSVSGRGLTNYKITNNDGNWSITPADPTCSISGYTGVYSGDPQGAAGYCTGLEGEILDGLNLGKSFTNVPGGTAFWAFADTNGNYNSKNGSVEIVISKADPTCSINGYSGVYDGESHSAFGSCTGVKGEPLSELYLGDSFMNVPGGTASWTFDDSTGNYNDSNGSVEIVINKAEPICSIDGYTGNYDGDPHGAFGSCEGVKSETLDGLNLGDSFTNVPGGTSSWTFADSNGNYNDKNGSVEIIINQADPTCIISNYTGVYDGEPHGASGSCTGVKGENLTTLALGEMFTNVPGGTASWTFNDSSGNYKNDSGNANIVINKAAPNCSISAYNDVYDGDPHGASGTCIGVKDEDLTNLDLGETFTDVSGGVAYWIFDDDSGNYLDDSGSVDITITKADPICVISGYNGTYDGLSHGASGSCTGVKSEALTGLRLGESFTNVPGGTASWAFTDETGNYNDDSGTAKIVILKAPLIITPDNQTAQYSDASPAPLTFQYAGFVLGEDVGVIDTPPTCSTTRLVDSPADSYAINCSGGEDNNYEFDYIEGRFTVTHEDAKILLDNEVAFLVDEPGEDIDTLVLYVDVQEITPDLGYGPAAGDINKAGVKMTLIPVGIGGPLTGVCEKFQDNGLTGYDQKNTYACTFTNVEVNTYLIEASVVGNYYVSSTAEDVLVVYDPSLGFTTAGGWFYWPGTSDKTNFGYTMKYNKKGIKVQGSLLLIRHTEAGNYRIKSNALYGLALGEFEEADGYIGWASFSGKCTYQEPDWIEPEGNHEFLVYVEDHGELGSGLDKLWIDVNDDDDNLSLGPDAVNDWILLNGGNIVVPHTPN